MKYVQKMVSIFELQAMAKELDWPIGGDLIDCFLNHMGMPLVSHSAFLGPAPRSPLNQGPTTMIPVFSFVFSAPSVIA